MGFVNGLKVVFIRITQPNGEFSLNRRLFVGGGDKWGVEVLEMKGY